MGQSFWEMLGPEYFCRISKNPSEITMASLSLSYYALKVLIRQMIIYYSEGFLVGG